MVVPAAKRANGDGHQRRSEQRGGGDDPDLGRAEAQRREVHWQQHSHESVAEIAQGAGDIKSIGGSHVLPAGTSRLKARPYREPSTGSSNASRCSAAQPLGTRKGHLALTNAALPDCRPRVLVGAIYGGVKVVFTWVDHLGWGIAMRMLCRGRALLLALLSTFAIMGSAPRTEASSAARIDADVQATLREFFSQVRGSRELVAKSAAVLVFPSVIKAGMGIGGEYGEGALLIRNRSVEYYNTVSASIGFQLGAQARSVIIVFMTPEALAGFRRVDGWKVGVDGSVALVTVGVGGSIDTTTIANPIVGFIFDGKGLMYNLTLEGSKITRIWR